MRPLRRTSTSPSPSVHHPFPPLITLCPVSAWDRNVTQPTVIDSLIACHCVPLEEVPSDKPSANQNRWPVSLIKTKEIKQTVSPRSFRPLYGHLVIRQDTKGRPTRNSAKRGTMIGLIAQVSVNFRRGVFPCPDTPYTDVHHQTPPYHKCPWRSPFRRHRSRSISTLGWWGESCEGPQLGDQRCGVAHRFLRRW
jgi:hypothetical protein